MTDGDRAAKISSLLNEAGLLAQKQKDDELVKAISDAAFMAFGRCLKFSVKEGREIEFIGDTK